MTDFERQIREAFDLEARSVPEPHEARGVIARTRRRQAVTVATGALAVVAFVTVSILGLRAIGTFDRTAPAGPSATTPAVVRPPAGATQIASGQGWRLLAAEEETSRGLGFCLYLVGPHLNTTSCDYASPPSGSANVDSLGSQGALFYGTVSTRAVRIEVHLKNGSVVVTNPFQPPMTLAIGRNLFVAELKGPRGSGIVTILDKSGQEIAIAELNWAEGAGSGFGFSAVPSA